MPEMIKNASGTNIRTLERVFEINTYALTTVEAYFRMFNMVISSGGSVNKKVVLSLNKWLEFMIKYCDKDMEYFKEALSQTKDQAVIDAVTKARKHIENLSEIAKTAISENNTLAE